MDAVLLVAIGFAVLFHRVAAYEHLSAWVWVVASMGLSFVVLQLGGAFTALMLAQIGLFGVLWWYNVRQVEVRRREQAARQDDERRLREERMRRVQQEIERDRERRARQQGD